MNATITLKEYLGKNMTFVIPKYQRGYVWGKLRTKGDTDSVSYILDDLIQKFNADSGREVFLQGVTVSEQKDGILLIDGQQRTTFFYFLLKSLGYAGKYDLHYDVRPESNAFLNEQIDFSTVHEDEQEQYQDIYFFKKTIRLIREKLVAVENRPAFLDFLLWKVKFLYIVIPSSDESEAMNVFAMMNGNRADMLPEEVIKAELLRLVSLGDDTAAQHDEGWLSREWECNMIRGRYAREWDKWLQWWNRDDVRKLYDCKNTMGHLVFTYVQRKKGDAVSLETFKSKCLENNATKDAAAIVFEDLRKLQKRFEDAFHVPQIHNLVGLVLRMLVDEKGKESFVRRYFAEGKTWNLETYADLALLDLSVTQCGAIVDALAEKTVVEEKIQQKFDEQFEIKRKSLDDPLLYENDRMFAMKWLLRLNMYEDSKLGRFFDYAIWEKYSRSLEHICSKSQVGHQDENGQWVDGNGNAKNEGDFRLKRDDIEVAGGGTEHGIGNLVLFYVNENQELGTKSYEEKIKTFFDHRFKSRHLLHTVSVFAIPKEYNAMSIAENRRNVLKGFEEAYKGILEVCNAK